MHFAVTYHGQILSQIEVCYKLNNLKYSKCPIVWNPVIWHPWESGIKIGSWCWVSFRKREKPMAESVEPQNRTDNMQKWFSVPPSQMTSVCLFCCYDQKWLCFLHCFWLVFQAYVTIQLIMLSDANEGASGSTGVKTRMWLWHWQGSQRF